MIDVASLSANELVLKLKSGDISSVELCKAYIKRIEKFEKDVQAVSYTHLRAHETPEHLVCRLLLEKKK